MSHSALNAVAFARKRRLASSAPRFQLEAFFPRIHRQTTRVATCARARKNRTKRPRAARPCARERPSPDRPHRASTPRSSVLKISLTKSRDMFGHSAPDRMESSTTPTIACPIVDARPRRAPPPPTRRSRAVDVARRRRTRARTSPTVDVETGDRGRRRANSVDAAGSASAS